MDRRTAGIIGALLLVFTFIPFVSASPEVVFQWEDSVVEEGEIAYINLYQNFEHDYNFTIISELVDECWVIKDYYDENKVVCRSENGLCKSIQPLDYKYIRCKTWNVYPVNGGERAILFYEYGDEQGRQQGIYQTRELFIPTWGEKFVASGPFMLAIIAALVVIAIVLGIIYLAGSSIASWAREWGNPETGSYEELKAVKNQIGSKGEFFSNCVVIY
ncbi:MAG: hypothetical protein JSV92_03460 [archaeon]|nr:MAG: hypothetical protein JSV92_03460 [archaeon]